MRPVRSVVPMILCVAVAAPALAQVPAGGELQVNTYTTNRQVDPRIAMARDASFVVVWSSSNQDDPTGYGVFGQRFASSGARLGGEFLVNAGNMEFNQERPDVAMGPRGDFVVVWQDAFVDGSSLGIRGQRFGRGGARVGGEFGVNSFTLQEQHHGRVERSPDGGFIASWTSQDGTAQDTASRRFDSGGFPVGTDFRVNTYTTGFQVFGDHAVGPDGRFVVTWVDTNGRDGSTYAIFGQRYDAGGNRVGGEFQVNTDTTGRQGYPAVSASAGGGFVVVWESPDGSFYGVRGQRLDAAGTPVGGELAINSYTTGEQRHASVAQDEAGNFVVVWQSARAVGSGYSEVWGRRFLASGAPRGPEFRVGAFSPALQLRPVIESDTVGNFVVTWMDLVQDGAESGVMAQRFGGLGPAALAVDTAGNRVLEPGEAVDVRPSWRNVNGAAQTFSGTLGNITGPAGAAYAVTDGAADYGTVPDGVTAPCTGCYAISVSNPPTRPAVHWDASAVESILPDAQGQQKRWLLHVGRSFADVASTSPFYPFVEALLHHGVTGGCAAGEYCPSASTTREQMAVFALVAHEGAGYVPPACATPVFADVPASSPFCRWVEELARRGVVAGCGGGNYCPSAPVSREQMAVFALRTLDGTLAPPPCGAPLYADVPASSPFCRWIEELTRRNVVTGCGAGRYCPAAPVTREQMGVFIAATFNLSLYGP